MTIQPGRPRRRIAGMIAPLLVLMALPAFAEAAASAQAAGYLTQLVGGLVLVILVILMLAWILRRLPGIPGQGSQVIEILAVRAVGSRESLLLVQVGAEQILIGVTPTGMCHLHTLRENVVLAQVSQAVEFADLFRRAQAVMGRPDAKQRDVEP